MVDLSAATPRVLTYQVTPAQIGDPPTLRYWIAQREGDLQTFGVGATKEAAVADLQARERQREDLALGREHLTVSGTFQSDKYSWCAAGFVPLKITDPMAVDLLQVYAERRRAVDEAFADDLIEALDSAAANHYSQHMAEREALLGCVEALREIERIGRMTSRLGTNLAACGLKASQALAALDAALNKEPNDD